METYISLIIEGLIFLVALIGTVGGVWAKLTTTINEQGNRLAIAETKLESFEEQKQQDHETRKLIFERFDNLESEIGEIDKKVTRIDATLGNGHKHD